MAKHTYEFEEELWLYPGEAASWHFVTVPKEISAVIKEETRGLGKGFGSVPVSVTIGETSWETSIFPDTKEGAYLLPVKSDVRKKQGITAGDAVKVKLMIRG